MGLLSFSLGFHDACSAISPTCCALIAHRPHSHIPGLHSARLLWKSKCHAYNASSSIRSPVVPSLLTDLTDTSLIAFIFPLGRQLAIDLRLEADLLLQRQTPSDAQLRSSTAGAAREPETQELSLHLLPGPIEVHPVQYAVLPG